MKTPALKHIHGLSALCLIAAFTAPALAAPPSQQLQDCLKRSEEAPDEAYAAALVWEKQGKGGREASTCLAMAEFNRGNFAEAAPRLAALAAGEKDAAKAAAIFNRAGWAWVRAGMAEKAEAQFSSAIEKAPDDPVNWTDRAVAAMDGERYWDALDDLKQAIKLDKTSADAYAWRASVWDKLGNGTNARLDAEAALGRDPKQALARQLYEKYPRKKAQEAAAE
ncbi:MAG: hypothetical protein GC131_03130 [Alphaproteobacteria bacterium]|nr:hypothetical protein [Alphaproteobacteria bacterium]